VAEPSAHVPLLYAIGGDQIPGYLISERLYAGDGRTWRVLPPLPVPRATALHPGITSVLAVLPDDRLAVFGVGPQTGVPPENTDSPPAEQQWLWLWDPATARWSLLPDPLLAAWPPACISLCWHASIISVGDGAIMLAISNSAFAPAALFFTRLPLAAHQ